MRAATPMFDGRALRQGDGARGGGAGRIGRCPGPVHRAGPGFNRNAGRTAMFLTTLETGRLLGGESVPPTGVVWEGPSQTAASTS